MLIPHTARPAIACDEPAPNSEQLGGPLNQTNIPTASDRQRATAGDRVIQSLRDDWAVFDGLHGGVALEIADRSFNRVIAAFRRDPRFAAIISYAELELILADARRATEFDVARHVDQCVALDDLRDLAERGFPTDGDAP